MTQPPAGSRAARSGERDIRRSAASRGRPNEGRRPAARAGLHARCSRTAPLDRKARPERVPGSPPRGRGGRSVHRVSPPECRARVRVAGHSRARAGRALGARSRRGSRPRFPHRPRPAWWRRRSAQAARLHAKVRFCRSLVSPLAIARCRGAVRLVALLQRRSPRARARARPVIALRRAQTPRCPAWGYRVGVLPSQGRRLKGHAGPPTLATVRDLGLRLGLSGVACA